MEVERAKALLNPRRDPLHRLNHFSGKWNFHFGPEDRVDDVVALVEAQLCTVTTKEQPAPEMLGL